MHLKGEIENAKNKMKAVVFTLGCKVNSCESASIITGLEQRGYEVSDKLEYSDIYIINTCAVTAEAEKKSRQAVARALKHNKNAKVIVMGCASECSPKSFSTRNGVTAILGTFSKQKVFEIIDKSGEFIEKQSLIFEEMPLPKQTKARAFIKIQDGCNNFCSYCIIPYLRGRSRSRSMQSIKNEIERLSPLEAVLTAINLTAYNYENNTLTDLILSLKEIKTRIRLGSLEENIITDEFLIALKSLKDFAPHFHLSLQSGSDNTLKAMNRKYTSKEFLESINKIRNYFSSAAITTDIIVGYPTETEEDFLNTLEFVKSAGFADVHCFPFSMRTGTNACKLKDLPPQVKKQRLDLLLKLTDDLKNTFINKNLGTLQEVVLEENIDGYTVGYTGNYIRTYVKGDLQPKKYSVKLINKYKDGVLAERIGEL